MTYVSTWVFLVLYFELANLSSPLAPLRGQIDICACGLICTKFNSEQLLFEAPFHVVRIFDSVEP